VGFNVKSHRANLERGWRMEQDIDVHLGKRLRGRRRILGLTQQQLAKVIGVRFQQIQKYECGANRLSAARLWRLAECLNVPVAYFFDGLCGGPKLAGAEQTCAASAPEESMDLVRAFYRLEESPRRRLLDLAKSLNGDVAAV
jgi:transcriptional regulator with XRE-family HTH domain